MYVKTDESNNVLQFPYSVPQLKLDNPTIGFPKTITDELLAQWNVYPVAETERPEPPSVLHKVTEKAPEFNGTQWERKWVISDRYSDIDGGPTKAEQEAVAIQKFIEQRCSEVDRINDEKLYTDVTVTFPSGDAEIQFRDERDRANLANVATAAMALVMGGGGASIVDYRTKDNVTQQVAATEMVGIAIGVLAAKQAIKTASWNHKDALRALTDLASVTNYDITTGWPFQEVS